MQLSAEQGAKAGRAEITACARCKVTRNAETRMLSCKGQAEPAAKHERPWKPLCLPTHGTHKKMYLIPPDFLNLPMCMPMEKHPLNRIAQAAAEGSGMRLGHRPPPRPGQGTRSLSSPRWHGCPAAWARLSATPASPERSLWHVLPWRDGDVECGANKAPEKLQKN